MNQQIQDLNRLYVEKFATAKPVSRAQKILLSMIGTSNSLLDVGCGSGYYTGQFRELGNQVTGTDLTVKGVNAVQAMGIPACVSNVELALPFEDDAFDVATCIEVVEHLLRPDQALREIHRVLKPGGTLILTTPNYAHWLLRILYLIGIIPVGLKPQPYIDIWARQPAEKIDPWLDPHIRFFSPRSISKLLSLSGFDMIKLHSTFVAFPSGLAPYLPWLPGLPLRIIGKLIGNLDFLGDYYPSLLAAGMMIKAIKR